MSRITAIVNQKGGGGKSTTALALGTALAERGQRVLLIDLDPQGSLTNNAGVAAHELTTTVYTAMAHVMSEGEAGPIAPLARPHHLLTHPAAAPTILTRGRGTATPGVKGSLQV